MKLICQKICGCLLVMGYISCVVFQSWSILYNVENVYNNLPPTPSHTETLHLVIYGHVVLADIQDGDRDKFTPHLYSCDVIDIKSLRQNSDEDGTNQVNAFVEILKANEDRSKDNEIGEHLRKDSLVLTLSRSSINKNLTSSHNKTIYRQISQGPNTNDMKIQSSTSRDHRTNSLISERFYEQNNKFVDLNEKQTYRNYLAQQDFKLVNTSDKQIFEDDLDLPKHVEDYPEFPKDINNFPSEELVLEIWTLPKMKNNPAKKISHRYVIPRVNRGERNVSMATDVKARETLTNQCPRKADFAFTVDVINSVMCCVMSKYSDDLDDINGDDTIKGKIVNILSDSSIIRKIFNSRNLSKFDLHSAESEADSMEDDRDLFLPLAFYTQLLATLGLFLCAGITAGMVCVEYNLAGTLSAITVTTALLGLVSALSWCKCTQKPQFEETWYFVLYIACYFYVLTAAIPVLVCCLVKRRETLKRGGKTGAKTVTSLESSPLVIHDVHCEDNRPTSKYPCPVFSKHTIQPTRVQFSRRLTESGPITDDLQPTMTDARETTPLLSYNAPSINNSSPSKKPFL